MGRNQVLCLILILLASARCAPLSLGEVPRCQGSRFEDRVADLFASHRYTELYELALPCAEAGHAELQFLVGILIGTDENGQIVRLGKQEREQKALKWIRRAAMATDEDALMMLADSYEHGWFGFPKNTALEDCWRSAIEDSTKIDVCTEQERKLGLLPQDQ